MAKFSYTGGGFRPSATQIGEKGEAQFKEEEEQATIAPSGQQGLPSQQTQSVSELFTPEAETHIRETADPAWGLAQKNTMLSTADNLFQGTRSAAPVATPGPALEPSDASTTLNDPRKFKASHGGAGRAISPTREDVLEVEVPTAGEAIPSRSSGEEGLFETELAREERYTAEQTRQTRPTYTQLNEAINNLGDDGAPAFQARSAQLAMKLQEYANQEPQVQNALSKSGVIDSKTGQVTDEAARTLLFTMATRADEAQKRLDRETAELYAAVENGDVDPFSVDSELEKKMNRPDLDLQAMQSSVATDFASIMGIEQVADKDLRLNNPDALLSPLTTQEKPILGVATAKALESLGFLERQDFERDGKVRTGYKIAGDFIETYQQLGSVLDEFGGSFRRGVTFTPNRGGAPSGLAGIIHRHTTKSPKKVGFKKGSEIWNAIDAMGTTPNGVNTMHLGTTMAILQSIIDGPRSANGGFSTHPLAEMFLLGSTTFMRFFKDGEVKDAFTGKRLANPNPITELKNADGTGLEQVYAGLVAQVRSGTNRLAAQARIDDILAKANKARYQQGLMSKTFIKAFMQGTNLNNKVFYHTYTPHAGTSRPMVASTEFNPQANKMARGLTSNPQVHMVKVDDSHKGTTENRQWRLIVARNLVHGADRAVSEQALIDSFESDVMGDAATVRLAKRVYEASPKDRGIVNAAAKNTSAAWNAEVQTNNKRESDFLPYSNDQFPNMGFTFNLEADDMALLAEKLELVKNGKPAKSDEVHFKLMALRELGEYIAKREGPGKDVFFNTQIIAEADGISNGVVIQGYQFGAVDVLKRGGVFYGPDGVEKGSVTPKGDMRQFIHQTLMTEAMNGENMNPAEATRWTEAFNAVFSPAGKADEKLIKKLHKLPVMTTPYGLDPDFHNGSIEEFLEENPEHKKTLMEMLGVDGEQLVKQMVKMEGIALREGLGGVIVHQAIIKNAANAAIAGGKLFVVKGPNGWPIISGGIERVEGDPISLNLDGDTPTQVYVSQSFGSPYASKTYDENKSLSEADKLLDAAVDPFNRNVERNRRVKVGTKLRNQTAVGATQNIDATTVQRGFVLAKGNTGKTFWGSQIFDAVIGDVGSYSKMVDAMNVTFDDVNQNFSMIDAEIDAVAKVKADVYKDIEFAKKNGLKFDVTPDGAYKGMYDILEFLYSDRARAANKKILNKLSHSDKSQSVKRVRSKDIAHKTGGSQMTPEQFRKAYDYVLSSLNIEGSMRKFQQQVVADRKEVKRLKDIDRAAGLSTKQYR